MQVNKNISGCLVVWENVDICKKLKDLGGWDLLIERVTVHVIVQAGSHLPSSGALFKVAQVSFF